MRELPEDLATRRARLREDDGWRKRAGDALRHKTAQVGADPSELDDKLREVYSTMKAESAGLPLSFHDESGKHNLPGGQLVRSATASDVENYAAAPGRICGTCKHFNLKGGQMQMVKQRFPEMLVLDHSWALRHLGAPLDHAGVCDGSGGEMVTMTVSNADTCPGYRRRNRLFR
ncbi:MAG: hypothetical protein V3R34_08850 [Hyphomicrobium sp.]